MTLQQEYLSLATADLCGVSVVVPTYNRNKVLCESIQHMLTLAVPANELLVIDQTPSHDAETETALSEWHDAGSIRWIRHTPPGVVGAMNRGLLEAKDDIVLFLDDDIVPGSDLVAAHRQAYVDHQEAWAVVGQVIQKDNPETLKTEMLKGEREPQNTQKHTEVGRETEDNNSHNSSNSRFKYSFLCILRILWLRFLSQSALRRDLDFDFSGDEPAWVENVMAGNLSVKRDRALAIGGFDENFIPPVSFRFETEFAKRIVTAGGRIRFEPKASILHLRATSGGTRSSGSHLTSVSPLHGVGDYYYALNCGRGIERVLYMLKRPFREVCTRFHMRHPWWIPIKFIGEIRALWMARRLAKRRSSGET